MKFKSAGDLHAFGMLNSLQHRVKKCTVYRIHPVAPKMIVKSNDFAEM